MLKRFSYPALVQRTQANHKKPEELKDSGDFGCGIWDV